MRHYFRSKSFVFTAVFAFFTTAAAADPLSEAIKTDVGINQAAVASQQKIDRIDDQSRAMLERYRQLMRKNETLKAYNAHFRQLLDSQEREKASLQQQLQEIEVTRRELVPLMLRMLDSLEQFVRLDVPFLPEERQQRLDSLKALMVRADVTEAEKFRRVLEAFQIENDYGHTIEAYRADLHTDTGTKPVDFLRLGRVALYYQTLDSQESGVWNPENKAWQVLTSDYRKPVRDGLRMARKEAAPDLLQLPIQAPEEAK